MMMHDDDDGNHLSSPPSSGGNNEGMGMKRNGSNGPYRGGTTTSLYKRGTSRNCAGSTSSSSLYGTSSYGSTGYHVNHNHPPNNSITSSNSSSSRSQVMYMWLFGMTFIFFVLATGTLHHLASHDRREYQHQHQHDVDGHHRMKASAALLEEAYLRKLKQKRRAERQRQAGRMHDNNDDGRWSNVPLSESASWYRQLRDSFDQSHGNILQEEKDAVLKTNNEAQRLKFVQKLRQEQHNTTYIPVPPPAEEDDVYDVYNCPAVPPANYPRQFPLSSILQNWNPDDVPPTPPSTRHLHIGICIFDYTKPNHYTMAQTYRQAELPFVLQNHPLLLQTVQRWNAPGYMHALLRKDVHRTEYSHSNHFMYWKTQPKRRPGLGGPVAKMDQPKGWTQPTENIEMDFETWFQNANVTAPPPSSNNNNNNNNNNNDPLATNQDHWYFRLNGCVGLHNEDCQTTFLWDELPFFRPQPSFFIVDPQQHRGINCRFGMRGNIAENHFDQSRNMIVLFGGARRYILSHPTQCENLALFPRQHPSGRHSAVDWSNLQDKDVKEYPKFVQAQANEVVLQAGDVLYLPTYWFHYIVSLEGVNYQCNTRSGMTREYSEEIAACGF